VSAAASVLYSDERVVAIAKPAGVSLATSRRDPDGAVQRLLAALDDAGRIDHGLDPALLRLVHRLDVGTSGVVLLARDADAHRELVTAFTTDACARATSRWSGGICVPRPVGSIRRSGPIAATDAGWSSTRPGARHAATTRRWPAARTSHCCGSSR